MQYLKVSFFLSFALAATSCTYINDSRTSNVAFVDSGAEAEYLEGIEFLDHQIWSLVLAEYASADGVAYSEILEDGETRYLLVQYLKLLGDVDPRGLVGREEKLAFYINIYNATVVASVVDRLEESPEFRVDLDMFSFFDEPLARVDGRLISLNVVEHAIVRGDLSHSSPSVSTLDSETREFVVELHNDLLPESTDVFDPRVHFLLNCASASCPPLQTSAVTGTDYHDVAEAATAAFLIDETRGAGSQGISQLFNWFASDFQAAGYDSASIFIGEYRLLDDVDTETFLPYDWSLNNWVRQ